jgi:hypothetical protein
MTNLSSGCLLNAPTNFFVLGSMASGASGATPANSCVSARADVAAQSGCAHPVSPQQVGGYDNVTSVRQVISVERSG